MQKDKIIIAVVLFFTLPLIFYAIFTFGKSEQRKIGSKLNQAYINNIKIEARNKALKDVQLFLKSQGIDLILDNKKNDLTNK